MIYTLTLNPALDYTVKIDKLEKGKIILSDSQHMAFGGKGINVSLVLKELDIPSVAMGFAAGDSTVAGFLAGYLKSGDLESALKLGVACGTATATCDGTATREQIEKFCK